MFDADKKNEILAQLTSLFLFRGISVTELEKRIPFAERCFFRQYADGELIQSADEPLRAIGVVTAGTAFIGSGSSERAVVLRKLMPGDVCGALSLYSDGHGYKTVIRALGGCRLLLLPEDAVKALIEADARAAENYIRFLSDRICFLNRKITAFTAGTAEAKLAAYLLCCPDGDCREIELPCGMSELAESLNISRASLYRAWDTLTEKGILSRNGKTVTVADPDALNKIIQE